MPGSWTPRAWGVNALFLILPVVLMWRPGFFYIQDDWILLLKLATHPFWDYVLSPDSEHWMPLFQLVYAGLVRLAGQDGYGWLVLLNCLVCGLNARLAGALLARWAGGGVGLTLGLLYACLAANTYMAYTAQALNIALSLTFFFTALLAADDHLHHPRPASLAVVGLAGLAVASINQFTLPAFAALPLYGFFAAPERARRAAWPLGLVVAGVYACYVTAYLHFAGPAAASIHNHELLSGPPGPGYPLHLLYAAYLSPFFYLFWGHYHFPVWVYPPAVALLAASLVAVRLWGRPAERRLALWALLMSTMPFWVASLMRYKLSVNQAFVPRYTLYTELAALLVIALAWLSVRRRWPGAAWPTRLAGGLLIFFLAAQLNALPLWTQRYQREAAMARAYFEGIPASVAAGGPERDARQMFIPARQAGLTLQEKAAIHRLVTGREP